MDEFKLGRGQRRLAYAPVSIAGLGTIAVLLFVFSVLLFGIGRSQDANADSFGICVVNNNSGCRADNFEHTYCFGATMAGNGFQAAAGNAMSNLVSQTRFTKTFMSSCSGNTDAVFKRVDGMPNVVGLYQCQDFVSGTAKCNRATLSLDGSDLAGATGTQKQATACHEVGHSGGLYHGGTNDCMRHGINTNIRYNGHHVDHLNAQN